MTKFLLLVVTVLFINGIFLALPAQPGIVNLKLLIANKSNEEALELFRELIAIDSDNPELWYLGGMAHISMMRQDSALVYISHAASLDSTDHTIAAALASVYSSLWQSAKAREIYRNMIRLDSTRLMPYIQMAALHMRDHEPRAALEIYLLLHSKEPDNQGFVKSIADCYRRSGNDLEAVRFYTKANSMNRADLSVNLALANLHSKMKNYRAGLEIAEEGLEVDRTHAQLLFWSGFFNYALGLHGQAIIRLQLAIKNGYESILAHRYLGICYFRTNQYEKARDHLEITIQSGVNDYRVYNYLGLIYRRLKDYELSEIFFYNALDCLEPDVPSITVTFLHLVDTYRLTDSFDKMAEAYNSALVYDGDNPGLHYGLAFTLDNYLDESEKALISYTRFTEIASENAGNGDELEALLDYANARIRKIKEDIFFGDQ
jgi:tetratricopeptide (TPR) repeat protein